MDAVILDTNIVSFIMKGHSRGELYIPHIEGKIQAISFMTMAELYKGAYSKPWSDKQMSKLEEELKKYLIIPYSPRMCEEWGRIKAERKHQPIADNDAWIAASAIIYDCPLVTDNSKHFNDITGLQMIPETSS